MQRMREGKHVSLQLNKFPLVYNPVTCKEQVVMVEMLPLLAAALIYKVGQNELIVSQTLHSSSTHK